MKICVYGAGAVGGHFAARLAAAGNDVSVVARGAHLAAIQANGLTLHVGDETVQVAVKASADPGDLGVQDLVIVTLKATSLAGLAEAAAPLLGPDTAVVFAQNGTPWWYDIGLKTGGAAAPDLGWLDPDGGLRRTFGGGRAIGGVIFSSNAVVTPGVIQNESPKRNLLIIGELDDAQSARVQAIRTALEAAKIGSPPADDIRRIVWGKLAGNMTISVVCALTGLTAKAAVEAPDMAAMRTALMAEAYAVADAHGAGLSANAAPAINAPDHKPSLLQDFELGRPMEIDVLVRGPQAFARAAGLKTPILDALGALAIAKARGAGLYA